MDFELPNHNSEPYKLYINADDMYINRYIVSHCWVGDQLLLGLFDKDLRTTQWNLFEETEFNIGQLDEYLQVHARPKFLMIMKKLIFLAS